MANIRIKDLSTTAAVTASDDFIAVDGATNGTRKLNAYSPTFGGNLTVSGTGVNTFNVGAGTSVISLNSTAASPTWISMTSGATTLASIARTGNDLIISAGNSGAALTLTYGPTQTATLAGNFTVSGTGTSSVGGSFGMGTTTPTTINGVANAYQQVANVTGSGTCALNITGTTAVLSLVDSNASANVKWLNLVNSAGVSTLSVLNDAGSTTQTGFQFFHSTGNFLFGTGSDGGQKLQVSGTAAISGALSIGNTVQTAVSVASTHKVTISIGGSTYYLLATNV